MVAADCVDRRFGFHHRRKSGIIRQVCDETSVNSTNSGNITDGIIMRYLDRHPHQNGFSPSA
jgi:hypothetical protein